MMRETMLRTEGRALPARSIFQATLRAALFALLSQSIGLSAYASTWVDKNIVVDIRAGTNLDDALVTWGAAAKVSVMVNTESIDAKITAGISGTLRARVALEEILNGSGLSFTFNKKDRIVYILPADPQGRPHLSDILYRRSDDDSTTQKDSNGRLPAADDRPVELEEVLVTAEKREERLIDVPAALTVISADDLAKFGATRFTDFANTVPGLSFTTNGAGSTQITLRGTTVGYDVSPTVGIYVDDVPYGSSAASVAISGQLALDVGLSDVDRVEVLRGPQGTLYGASTMGGLIKYSMKQPTNQELSGDVRTGVSGTQYGGVNYEVAGDVNVPIISNVAAARVSGYESHDGGYVDNVALNQDNVNRSNIYGARVDLLVTPTDALSIKVGGFLQNLNRHGMADGDYAADGTPIYGNYNQFRATDEPFDQEFRLGSAKIDYDFRWSKLTSISSYQSIDTDYRMDVSKTYVPLLNGFGLGPYGTMTVPTRVTTHKFTEEVRLASEGTHVLDWLFGVFYNRENSAYAQYIEPSYATGAPAPLNLFNYYVPSTYKEVAGFGDLTWNITSKLDVTAGFRYARNNQVFTQYGSGLLVGSAPTSESSEDVKTYLANMRYRFDEHTTAYARFATGYRPGGPNFRTRSVTTGQLIGASNFNSDSLKSYELGLKAETSNRRFGVDVAGYYIDWNRIQIVQLVGGFAARTNAIGSASVRGIELALTARPINDINLTATVAYQDGHMDQADPVLLSKAGERLPYVPRVTAALNGEYVLSQVPVLPTFGASVRYVASRTSDFVAKDDFYFLPSYVTVDIHAGATIEKFDVQLYLRNLLNDRAQYSGTVGAGISAVALGQPRTVGVTVSHKF